jgi:hypothetical protein
LACFLSFLLQSNITVFTVEYTENLPVNLTYKSKVPKAAPQLRLLVAGFPPLRLGFDPGSGQVGFVVDKVALGQVSPANLHSTNCSTITVTYHLRLVQ